MRIFVWDKKNNSTDPCSSHILFKAGTFLLGLSSNVAADAAAPAASVTPAASAAYTYVTASDMGSRRIIGLVRRTAAS
ncbi:hypothetical protein V493_05758 [Pseudogymnoascus sp. VKM F-4281 (FW-2241)]|nr:hypothetical protein V493_05758 [Pseudogymnoascus sp. VKM F-4281 (FW-2241)]